MSKGFTLVETLFATILSSWLLLLLVSCIQLVIKIPIDHITQSDIAIQQLKWQLAYVTEFYIEDQQVCYTFAQSNHCFIIQPTRLIITPGWRIVLDAVSDITLELTTDSLELGFYDENKTYQAIIKHFYP